MANLLIFSYRTFLKTNLTKSGKTRYKSSNGLYSSMLNIIFLRSSMVSSNFFFTFEACWGSLHFSKNEIKSVAISTNAASSTISSSDWSFDPINCISFETLPSNLARLFGVKTVRSFIFFARLPYVILWYRMPLRFWRSYNRSYCYHKWISKL